MSESTLSVSKDDLDADCGDFAGFGRGPIQGTHAWDARQQQQINNAVKIGQRWVYYPHELIGADGRQVIPGGYEHSFLRPVATIVALQGKNTLDMPDDFGGIVGRLIPASPITGVGGYFQIRVIGESQMYSFEAITPSRTGRPFWALIEQPKNTSPNEGQRAKLRFYPTPDADYTLKIWYDILPDAITENRPYPYGGAQHGETFRAAVRAAYDLEYNDRRGNAWAVFVERLKGSVAIDRRMKPQELGRNRDASDDAPFGFGFGGWGKHVGPFSLDIAGVDVLPWTSY